ncbi:hypothetical protein DPEC_G00106670 [Dallia pectoralis]|uniref:Uncharacterized protein n=1 Tax=Dallia pectoralis TaxID=75939 RepID=A0ACC2GYK1_DALPE|nr:hypothetical protein DPEC_G00106670 [Dallia pectoralis]
MTSEFYKDGILISNVTRGEMTIPAVYKSDEGWYWCENSEENSTKSWMNVTASITSSFNTTSPSSFQLPLLLISLSVSGVALLIFSIILLLSCYHKRTKVSEVVTSDPREVLYADVRIKQDQEHRERREKTSSADPVYSAVKPNTVGGASAGPMDVTYGQVEMKTKKKKKEKHLPPEPDVIYQSVLYRDQSVLYTGCM